MEVQLRCHRPWKMRRKENHANRSRVTGVSSTVGTNPTPGKMKREDRDAKVSRRCVKRQKQTREQKVEGSQSYPGGVASVPCRRAAGPSVAPGDAPGHAETHTAGTCGGAAAARVPLSASQPDSQHCHTRSSSASRGSCALLPPGQAGGDFLTLALHSLTTVVSDSLVKSSLPTVYSTRKTNLQHKDRQQSFFQGSRRLFTLKPSKQNVRISTLHLLLRQPRLYLCHLCNTARQTHLRLSQVTLSHLFPAACSKVLHNAGKKSIT
ncbi:hypothetical protein E2C01_097226 [Portunus trituberculatus]|uniref:Uncharacterized protein n=1 Tax=Portunus trituberculatus TaxID=210409 RepID=A0A5B7K437_PORTR|nr:hypothetical protein [Portunus trituberculatus]